MLFTIDFYQEPRNLLFLLFLVVTIIQLYYFWFYHARVAFGKNKASQTSTPPVSVVICAKNEFENLKNNLPLILEQDYPSFEVILVNDYSEDDSFFLLKSLEEKYKHFRVINLRENVNFFAGKKLALAVGIKSAKNEFLLLTDADCRPAGNQWIRTMINGFVSEKEIVLGFGGYEPEKSFLNKLIRFDTIAIALQYMGMALAGKPYMGVGRNLAYKKSLFYRIGGFTSHYKINSGDDDLFVNQAATGNNTVVCLNPAGFTYSNPKKTFWQWFRQKKRHMSSGVYYRKGDKIRLGIYSLSGFLFYTLFVLTLLFSVSIEFIAATVGLFLWRIISLMLMHYYSGKRFMEKKLFLYSPIFDVLIIFLNPLFAISNLFYRKNKWK